MTHPATLSIALREAGMMIRLSEDGKLLVNPVAKLEGELREQVIANRQALITWLARAAGDEARIDAVAREAIFHDPFAGTEAAFGLRESVLIRTNLPGEPPEYAAFDPDWLRDFQTWVREERQINARKAAEREEKQKKASKKKEGK